MIECGSLVSVINSFEAVSDREPFGVRLALCEQPTLNEPITAVVWVHNGYGEPQPNNSIELRLFKRTNPHVLVDGFIVWRNVLWNGIIPPNEIQTASTTIQVEEPGLYILTAAGSIQEKSFYAASTAVLHLNITEDIVEVRDLPIIAPEPPPPPDRPYVIKMDLDGTPALNQPVGLTVTIASLMDVENATFGIFLPEGIELVSGDLL